MAKGENETTLDPEIAAINAVVTAIRDLDASTQQNVIDYVIRRFKLRSSATEEAGMPPAPQRDPEPPLKDRGDERRDATKGKNEAGLEGISPVARKWMSRNGFGADTLSKLFSLGIEEIDLVAKKVPGRNKKDRMRSVILLKSVAAYLGGGAARVSDDQLRETCLHYDALDTSNFATYLKEMSAEVGGTKEAGYTLTPRGLNAATELVKEILNPSTK